MRKNNQSGSLSHVTKRWLGDLARGKGLLYFPKPDFPQAWGGGGGRWRGNYFGAEKKLKGGLTKMVY